MVCFGEQHGARQLFLDDWVALRSAGWCDLMQADVLFGLTVLAGLAGRS